VHVGDVTSTQKLLLVEEVAIQVVLVPGDPFFLYIIPGSNNTLVQKKKGKLKSDSSTVSKP
jgi:hypothetical protein